MNVKRPIGKALACSENELYNLELLTAYYNSLGDRIYPTRVVNHLVYNECIRLGLAAKPCVEDSIIREKEIRASKVDVKPKSGVKKLTKKQIEDKKLEQRLLEILE